MHSFGIMQMSRPDGGSMASPDDPERSWEVLVQRVGRVLSIPPDEECGQIAAGTRGVFRALPWHKMPSCRLLAVFLRRVGDALKVVGGKMRRLVVDSEALLPAIKCTQMVA